MSSSAKNDVALFGLTGKFDYKNQSYVVPGSKKPGQTAVYRHAAFPDMIDFNTKGIVPNLVDLFQLVLKRFSNQPCLGHRQQISANPLKFASTYTWITYAELDQKGRNIGSALEYLWEQGRAGGGDLPTIGVWSQNRAEWPIIDLASYCYGKVTVALYSTLGRDAVEYICNHAEISVIFVDADHLPTFLSLASRLKFLKVIVCIDELIEPRSNSADAAVLAKTWASKLNLEFYTFSELEALGMKNSRPLKPSPPPDQLYTICYTSGTTGNPKGVLLTHGQFAMTVFTGLSDLRLPVPGRMLSYLPVAHILGRGLELSMICHGVSIGYFTGDPLRLLEDAQVLQPTFFPLVPRILNRIYQAANIAGSVPGIKGELFRRAVATKLANYHATGQLTHPIWDRLIFRKIQEMLGGKVQRILCGSAPVSADCLNFCRIALACDIYEGEYGMTETTGVGAVTITGDNTSTRTVGPPQPACEIKLVDVPSMNYFSDDKPCPRGEFCSRGVVNTKGYYKDPIATAKLIDKNGWLHTGDIAEIDSCGRFRVIDRIDNIIKLSQGEYVALEKIQNIYSSLPFIAQLFIYGDSMHNHLIGIVVLELESLTRIASSVGLDKTASINPSDLVSLRNFTKDHRVKSYIMNELNKYGISENLNGLEMIKDIILTVDPFSVEDGTMTPTLKFKRREIYNKYKREIDALYDREMPIRSTRMTGGKL